MREIIGLIIFAIMFLAFASTAEAQLLNRLKDRAKNAAENRVEQKIGDEVEKAAERMVENSWNSIFGDGFNESGDGFNIPFSLNSNAVTEDAYNFDVVTTMEIETTKKNGKTDPPMIMQMHFNENELYSGTKFSGEQMDEAEGEIFIIYDLKNESMVMLMESEEGKFSFAYDWRQAREFAEEYAEKNPETEDIQYSDYEDDYEGNNDEPDHWQDFEKIGTKTIAGIECHGYTSQNDDVRMEYWVTNDEDFGIHNMLRTNSQTKQLKGKVPDDQPIGMLMEMMHEDINTGEKTTMRVTEINRNTRINYNMADYPAMSFGGSK